MGVLSERGFDFRENRSVRIKVRLLILLIMIILLGCISLPVEALEGRRNTSYVECPLHNYINVV